MRKKRDFFATSILSESISLQFDSEGRISPTPKLLKHAKKIVCCLLVRVKHFKYGNQQLLKNLRLMRKKSNLNRASLKWEQELNK